MYKFLNPKDICPLLTILLRILTRNRRGRRRRPRKVAQKSKKERRINRAEHFSLSPHPSVYLSEGKLGIFAKNIYGPPTHSTFCSSLFSTRNSESLPFLPRGQNFELLASSSSSYANMPDLRLWLGLPSFPVAARDEKPTIDLYPPVPFHYEVAADPM